MIKKFLQCKTVRERIDMLSNTVLGDWSDQDLNIILNALGFSADDFSAKDDKIAAIEKYFADYKHRMEQESVMDCEEMDSLPARDTGATIFEEKGLVGVLAKVLN